MAGTTDMTTDTDMAYDPNEALKLKNQLCFPLYAAARQVVNAYTPYLKPLGITYTQYIVLMVLWEKDDITIGEIGSALHLDNGTLTPLLKKMEALGYLTRERSRKDERVVTVKLTEEGRRMKKRASEVPWKVQKCVPLERKDALKLYELLYKILEDI